MSRGVATYVPKLGLLVSFVILALSACGGEEAKARTIPEKGPLSAGRYSTQEVEPSFSFEVGEGWRVSYPEEPYSVELAEGEGKDKQLAFYTVQEIFEPRKGDGEVYFEAMPAPDDLFAWFQRHPYIDTDETKPVDIGGAAGKRFSADFNVPKGYADVYGGGCSAPCIPILQLGGDLVIHALEDGSADEFIVLDDVQGKTVILWIAGPPDEFGTFLPKAQKVLDTVEWLEA